MTQVELLQIYTDIINSWWSVDFYGLYIDAQATGYGAYKDASTKQ